ncbi:MAG TPA: tRNA (adenine(22)-N(1))-methyltransferase TrmK [Planococcus sp. (in: firmicutes)]|nr:tRNA (adenine(22)-N(1))-methyltransferase TrmK [Planococcus sp. (in: firmicutes)]
MNAQQLSERLTRVASHVPEGSVLADIGSDHAYLPCFLVLKGVAHKAIAGEVVQGPYDSARNQVIQENLVDRIQVRLASGMDAVNESDGVTAVTIAGMGGPLIRTILEQGNERLSGVKRLILQPNIHAKSIREWAQRNNWEIIEEEILKENNKTYEILVLEPSRIVQQLSEAELLLGPKLIKEQSPIFKEKWEREKDQWNRIVQSIGMSEQNHESRGKISELESKIKLVEEVLNK